MTGINLSLLQLWLFKNITRIECWLFCQATLLALGVGEVSGKLKTSQIYSKW